MNLSIAPARITYGPFTSQSVFAFDLGDAGEETVSGLDEPVTPDEVGPERQATDAGVSEHAVAERKLRVCFGRSLEVGSGRRFHALVRLGCPVCVAIQHGSLSGESHGG